MLKIKIYFDGVEKQIIEEKEGKFVTFGKIKSKWCNEKIIIAKYNCNTYIREEDFKIENNSSVEFITYKSPEGYRIHQASVIYLLNKAFDEIFVRKNKPNKRLVVEHSIGDGVYCETFTDGNEDIHNVPLTKDEIKKLSDKINDYINRKLDIVKVKVKKEKAFEIFKRQERDDLTKIFSGSSEENIELYKCEDYYDYSIRELVVNTSTIKGFDIKYLSPGLIIRFPDKNAIEIGKFELKHKLFKTHQLHDKWLNILQLHNVTSLNRRISQENKFKEIKRTILIEEALHENKIVEIASTIATKMKQIKLVLIAGPSSSGKTTFAKRLDIQLRVEKLGTKVLNLDNYFVSRDRTPRKENGDFDFESIYALDLDLLNEHLNSLLKGKEINIPKYDFKQGLQKISDKKMKLEENDILIIEGIHGLNEQLTESVPFYLKTKIYVSALNNLNIDSHNRIATTDSRKIRRIIRDSKYRNHPAEKTLSMWEAVREGEDKNIFPYQENADFMFNSTLTYELGVLKKHALKELMSIKEENPNYLEAQRLLKILSHFKDIPDEIVPLNSILREFIGGNIFDY